MKSRKEVVRIMKDAGEGSNLFSRFDGRLEWLCPHGIGHTIWHPEDSDSIHGCDGCCGTLKVLQ